MRINDGLLKSGMGNIYTHDKVKLLSLKNQSFSLILLACIHLCHKYITQQQKPQSYYFIRNYLTVVKIHGIFFVVLCLEKLIIAQKTFKTNKKHLL